jgi:hypothetical protein
MNVALFSTFSAIAPGGADGPDTPDAFTNKFAFPIWVRDIVFDWDWSVTSRTQVKTYGTPLGDVIRARLVYKNHPLTSGYIPIRLLARITDWRSSTPPFFNATATSGNTVHSTFLWRLAQPLWVPPDAAISVRIAHTNDFPVDVVGPSQDVDVTIRGELDESGMAPPMIDLPFASFWLGNVLSTVSGGSTGLSPIVTERTGQTDLYNPFDQPLMVERMQYEISISSHGKDLDNGAANANFAPTDETSGQDQTSQLASGQAYGLDRRYVQIKMTSAKGRNLIKDFIPIGNVLSSTNRAMAANSVLDPAHYYLATIQSQMPLFVDRGTLPFQMRTGLSLVGSRRIPLNVLDRTY